MTHSSTHPQPSDQAPRIGGSRRDPVRIDDLLALSADDRWAALVALRAGAAAVTVLVDVPVAVRSVQSDRLDQGR